MLNDAEWAAHIVSFRKQRQMTQQVFADFIGAHRTAVARWERSREIPSLFYRQRLERLTLAVPETMLRGIVDSMDNLDAPATLLDGKFHVVKLSRKYQEFRTYDVAEVYGTSAERYWSGEMERIVTRLGGLGSFAKLGVEYMDLSISTSTREPGAADDGPMVSIGRTAAIGDTRRPLGYLTTLRLVRRPTNSAPPTIKTADGLIVLD